MRRLPAPLFPTAPLRPISRSSKALEAGERRWLKLTMQSTNDNDNRSSGRLSEECASKRNASHEEDTQEDDIEVNGRTYANAESQILEPESGGEEASSPDQAPPEVSSTGGNSTSGDGTPPTGSSLLEGSSPDDDAGIQPKKLRHHFHSIRCEFFHDSSKTPYISRPCGPERKGRITLVVGSASHRSWIRKKWFDRFTDLPSKTQVQRTVDFAEMDATHLGDQGSVHVGVAWQRDVMYFDLRRDDGKVVRVDRDGWDIVSSAPVHFLRKQGMHSLPLPKQNGKENGLRKLQSIVNIRDEDLPLSLAFLLSIFQQYGERPLLFLHGAAGSGKTTAAKFFKDLLDSHEVTCQTMSSSEEDLLIAAQHGSILAFDNLSGRLSKRESDMLCRLASGSGLQKRELYSDAGLASLKAQAGVVLTSIDNVINRGDLIDRTFKVVLSMNSGSRRSQSRLRGLFERVHPVILGGLLDAVSTGIRRLKKVQEDESWDRPRLMDTAEWIVACEPALPVEQGECLRALSERHEEMKADMLEGNSVFKGLLRLTKEFGEGETRTYSASSLLMALKEHVSSSSLSTPKGISEDLNRRMRIYEEELGIEIVKNPNDRHPKTRLRQIHITKLAQE